VRAPAPTIRFALGGGSDRVNSAPIASATARVIVAALIARWL